MKKFTLTIYALLTPFICWSQIDLFELTLNGSANIINDNCYELTPNLQWQGGSLWSANQIDLNQSFTIETQLFLGCKYTNYDCGLAGDDDGADGVVFALQQLSTTIGTEGGQLGFGGFEPSLGIEFDTYYNSEYNDPNNPVVDHIAIIKNGSVTHNTPNTIAGPIQASAISDNIEDCSYHNVKIDWNHITKTIAVYFDCELRLSTQIDLVNDIFNGEPNTYWGFTSATGSCSNEHKVCFLIPPTFNAENVITMCKGDSVKLHNLKEPENFSFSWFPVDFMLDPNSFNPLVNPPITSTYTLTLTNECNEISEYKFIVEVNECDCNDVSNGTAIVDECGECFEPTNPDFNSLCIDCKGILNGISIVDECGVCLNPADTNFNQSCSDCKGAINGMAVIDDCGVCVEPNDAAFNQSCSDCKGIINGTALVDDCGKCLEVSDSAYNQTCLDCKGVLNGPAIIDDCGECLNPIDSFFNECLDCNGIVNGTAVLDSCGVCLAPDDPNLNQHCRKTVYLPNAFSPNGDGMNDTFDVSIYGDFDSYDLIIYNRWGQKVFQSDSYNSTWDGENYPMEVYIYYLQIIFADATKSIYKGNITLIR